MAEDAAKQMKELPEPTWVQNHDAMPLLDRMYKFTIELNNALGSGNSQEIIPPDKRRFLRFYEDTKSLAKLIHAKLPPDYPQTGNQGFVPPSKIIMNRKGKNVPLMSIRDKYFFAYDQYRRSTSCTSKSYGMYNEDYNVLINNLEIYKREVELMSTLPEAPLHQSTPMGENIGPINTQSFEEGASEEAPVE